MQAKKSWPGSLCHKLKLGLSRTNFFMSQNFRRPQIDPRRCPKTLSNPKFDADSISEVRSVVSLDLGALQHAWLRSMARMVYKWPILNGRSKWKPSRVCFLMHSMNTSKRQIAHQMGCGRYEDVASLHGGRHANWSSDLNLSPITRNCATCWVILAINLAMNIRNNSMERS